MSPLRSGKRAPQFALKDKDGILHRLSEIETPYTVVFFYPKDNTPGCTIEAKEFSKHLKRFNKLGVTVIGISGGDERSKEAFCHAHKLKVTLLSDPTFSVVKKFGSFGKKNFMGRTYQGIFRNTFVLDHSKKVIKIYDKVTPQTHAEEILDFIRLHASEGGARKKPPAKRSPSPGRAKTALKNSSRTK